MGLSQSECEDNLHVPRVVLRLVVTGVLQVEDQGDSGSRSVLETRDFAVTAQSWTAAAEDRSVRTVGGQSALRTSAEPWLRVLMLIVLIIVNWMNHVDNVKNKDWMSNWVRLHSWFPVSLQLTYCFLPCSVTSHEMLLTLSLSKVTQCAGEFQNFTWLKASRELTRWQTLMAPVWECQSEERTKTNYNKCLRENRSALFMISV